MCRSIKRLREGATALPRPEIEEAARQYVRKVSGFQQPAAHNQAVFNRAVTDIADATETLLDRLVIRGVSSSSTSP